MQLSRQILVLEVDQPYQYVSKLSMWWYEIMKNMFQVDWSSFFVSHFLAGPSSCHAIISFTKTDSFRTLTFRVRHHVVDVYRDISVVRRTSRVYFKSLKVVYLQATFQIPQLHLCCVVLWIILWPKRKRQTVFVGLFWEVVNTETERPTRNPLKHE